MAERRPPGFNVDLGFYDSDEVLSIPRKIRAAAIGVWTLCGSYSANKLTDGYVSAEALRDRGCTPAIRKAVIASTLWEDVGDGAIRFVKWPKWQRTAAEIKAYRDAEAERKRKAREAKKGLLQPDVDATSGSRGDHVATTWRPDEPYIANDINATSAPRNDNTQPATSTDTEASGRTSAGRSQAVRPEDGDPKTKTETETKKKNSGYVPSELTLGSPPNAARGTRLPNGWEPPTDVVAQMRSDHPGIDLRAEHAKFADYWRAKAGKDGRKADWTATWRNWIRRAAEQRPAHTNGNQVHKLRAVADLAREVRADETAAQLGTAMPRELT